MNTQTSPKTFEFMPGISLRVVEIGGEPWFVAKDVCDALGLSDVTMSLHRLDSDERAKLNLGQRGLGAVNGVSESGLYSLVLRSRKPEAHAFRKWVTSVVLPAIRRDGAYIKGEEAMDEDQLIAAAMAAMQRKIARLTPQAHGMDPELRATMTVKEFRKQRGLVLTHAQKVYLGVMARNLSRAAGQEQKQRQSNLPAHLGGHVVAVGEYPVETLERAARAIGIALD
ncbi:BRO-N domain-containing protein [Achromobacter aegrifaciens]